MFAPNTIRIIFEIIKAHFLEKNIHFFSKQTFGLYKY